MSDSVYYNFDRTKLDAFVKSSYDARDEAVQIRVFWSCASGRKLTTTQGRFPELFGTRGIPIYALRWLDGRFPDHQLNYAVNLNAGFELFTEFNDAENNPYWDQISPPPSDPQSDTDPILVRVWAYEIRGKSGKPIVTQIPWGQNPPAPAIRGLGRFHGRAEVSGYAVGVTPVTSGTLPTITGEQYGEAHRHGRNIADDLFLAWEAKGPITFSGGGGTGAAAHVERTSTDNVARIVVDEPGAGYTTAPTVHGARARAVLKDGKVDRVELLGKRNSDVRSWNIDTKQNSIRGFGTGRVFGVDVDDGGSGYVTAPEVKFVGGTGSGARAHTTVANGSVSSVEMDDYGSGYEDPPRVVIGSGMSGTFPAAAEVVIKYKIVSLVVQKSGTGYTSIPTVTVSGGGAVTQATAHAALTGSLTSIDVTSPGNYPIGPPAVKIEGGGGSGATAVALMSGSNVIGVRIGNRGAGYTSAPTISFFPTVSTPAVATASFTADTSVEVFLDDGGVGYLTTPTVTVDPPPAGGEPCQVVAALGSGIVTLIEVTYAGEGYPAPPALTFLGGGGSGLAAHAVLGDHGEVTGIVIDDPGTGYSTKPRVKFDNVHGATATALLDTIYDTFGCSGYSLSSTSNLCFLELDDFNEATNSSQNWGFGFNGAVFGEPLDADDYVDPYYVGALQAAAVANITVEGHIDSITITDPGDGYGKAPNVRFRIFFDPDPEHIPSPIVPTGFAEISGGKVTRIVITYQGQGYLGAAVIIDPPVFNAALATSEIEGSVAEIVMDSVGSDYQTTEPAVTVDGNCRAQAVVEGGQVVRIVVTDPGSGYKAAPSVTVQGNARAHAVLNGSVSKITITNRGLGYVDPPQVRFPYGDASARAKIERKNGTVTEVDVTNSGSGYTEPPLVFLEVPDPLEVQKPKNEKVKLFVMLVPGGYDPNHTFTPNLNAPYVPCFWLDGVITGNTYYTYFEMGTSMSSSEFIDVKCATPSTIYGSSTVDAFQIPPDPILGFQDAFGHNVSSGDFWWFAGPESQLGGGYGFGAYTVAFPSIPFFTYEGYDMCGGPNNMWCTNYDEGIHLGGVGPCEWDIFWEYSDTYSGVGYAHTDVGVPPYFIDNIINYYINSTHSPRHLRHVGIIPNMNQIYGKLDPGYFWHPLDIGRWTPEIFEDEPASFFPQGGNTWPPIVPGGLFDEDDGVPRYYFPLTYGNHHYVYMSYFPSGINQVARDGPSTRFITAQPEIEVTIGHSYVDAMAAEWTITRKIFAPVIAQLKRKTREDMSFLVDGIIAGGAPFFGDAYRMRDINFSIADRLYTATAHAVMEGGEVVQIVVDYPGAKYGFGTPDVHIIGGDPDEPASAVIEYTTFGEFIGPVVITYGGKGYKSTPEVSIDPSGLNNASYFLPTKASRP